VVHFRGDGATGTVLWSQKEQHVFLECEEGNESKNIKEDKSLLF